MFHRIGHAVWHRHHRLVHSTKHIASLMVRGVRSLPIPLKVRRVTMDVFSLSIERFIVNNNLHRQSRRQRAAGLNLGDMSGLRPDQEDQHTPLPCAPTDAQFAALPEQYHRAGAVVHDALVDVVMPVYRDYDQTLNALWRVLQTTGAVPFELIVINDCSPDPQITLKLRELAAARWFTLIENPQNLGYVHTVNKGMQIHGDRDIVLLNADTEVFGNWLERLYHHAYTNNAIGTVTPLSNNAELCSYPFTMHNNTMPLEVDFATLDQLTAQVNAARACELPTANGFCMYIKRRCLRDIGFFDADTFARGYGEDIDFCLRAQKHSWKHMLASDVFVRHIGATSFSNERNALMKQGMKKIHARYPHHATALHHFIKTDPSRALRQRLDLARLKHAGRDVNMLMVHQGSRSDADGHVYLLCQALQDEGMGAYQLSASPSGGGGLQLAHPNVPHTPNLHYSMEYDREAFFEAMLELGISHLHIHQLRGFPHRILDFIAELSKALAIRYDVTLHDYFAIDPRAYLIGADGYYHEEPDIEILERMLQQGASTEGIPLWQWRLHFGRLLRDARRVFVPDEDVHERMLRYLPEAVYTLRPHPTLYSHAPLLTRPAPNQNERLCVAVIGTLNEAKGSHVLANLARDAAERELPLHFILIGDSDHAELSTAKHYPVTVTGAFRKEEIEPLLRKHQPHLVLIPNVWPETHSDALTIALQHGIYPVVFDLGAPARRVRTLGFGGVIPFTMAKNPTAVNNYLMTLEPSEATVMRPADQIYTSYRDAYYELEMPWSEGSSNVAAPQQKKVKSSERPQRAHSAT